MASKREDRKEDLNPQSPSSQQTTSGTASSYRQQQAATRAIEETKDNIKRAVEETRREIPRYTQTVNDYQHQTIDAAKEMADSYLESQKEAVNSFQSRVFPYFQNAYWWWSSPQTMADLYTNVIGTVADNTIAMTRMANNMMFANMEAARVTMNYAKDSAKEMSRLATNTTKSIQQSWDNAQDRGRTGS